MEWLSKIIIIKFKESFDFVFANHNTFFQKILNAKTRENAKIVENFIWATAKQCFYRSAFIACKIIVIFISAFNKQTHNAISTFNENRWQFISNSISIKYEAQTGNWWIILCVHRNHDDNFFLHNINYCEQFYQRTNELVNNMSFGVAKTIQVVRYLFFRFKFENMGWKEAILSRFPTNFQLSRTCEL